MKLRILLASLAAICFASVFAAAGFSARQVDTGAFCLQESNGTTVADRWCLNGGTFNYFEICGDATTVNNNTVYYGPSQAIVSSATVGQITCDTTAAGNATEATADAPALSATAFYPLGMTCYNDDNTSGITYTLRNNAEALSPAITVTLADNILVATSSPSGTSLIASGNPVAVAVASAGDIGTVHFICRVFYAS